MFFTKTFSLSGSTVQHLKYLFHVKKMLHTPWKQIKLFIFSGVVCNIFQIVFVASHIKNIHGFTVKFSRHMQYNNVVLNKYENVAPWPQGTCAIFEKFKINYFHYCCVDKASLHHMKEINISFRFYLILLTVILIFVLELLRMLKIPRIHK